MRGIKRGVAKKETVTNIPGGKSLGGVPLYSTACMAWLEMEDGAPGFSLFRQAERQVESGVTRLLSLWTATLGGWNRV